MKIFRWDDSLAVVLPEAIVGALELVHGDELQIIEVVDGKIMVGKRDRKAQALKSMERRAWSAPADYRFNRDEANER